MKKKEELTVKQENYLERIFEIYEETETPVSISEVSRRLEVSKSTVFNACSQLEKKGYIHKHKNGKIILTEKGESKMIKLKQFENAWIVFLKDFLDFSLYEAADYACKIEHFMPEEVSQHLKDFIIEQYKSD